MAPRLKVTVVGASGETGSSIAYALLASLELFEVTALARPISVTNQAFVDLSKSGATVKAVDLSDVSDALVETLFGMDIVIECMTPLYLKEQRNLVEAASLAKVGRYVPSFFATVCPSRGVMGGREKKEDILDRIKYLYLPYTIIDVGWWYQLSLTPLPSGRIKSRFEYANTEIVGDGETVSAYIDNRDIGKYVSRIIADPRTLNKMVFAYGELWTQNRIWDMLEKISGETIERKHLSGEEMTGSISAAHTKLLSNPSDWESILRIGTAQYKQSMDIRGDNNPEQARYLGYLDAKELYPDVEVKPLEEFAADMIEGKVRLIYSKS